MNVPIKKNSRESVSIEELERTLSDLRSAVRASNPLLRAVASSRLYPALSLILGVISVVFCFVARAAERNPEGGGLGPWSWVFLIAVFIIGGAGKVIITSRLAARQGGRSFYALMTAIYGGKASTLIASSAIVMIAGAFFLVWIGHPWYIAPITAIYTGLASHAFDLLIDLAEYRVLGWVAMAAGIVALFFVESDPLLWTAIVTAAVFVVFGFAGLAAASAREKGKRR
ncbi:MAG TPA: hypothetical protein VN445_14295 [Rectinemataceae bacterium]|nr:hypothetical protein [Rectinemataceae bacterium]